MDPDEAAAGPPSPFSAQSVYPADTGATNPALAKEFLEQHRQQMQQRQPDIDQTLGQMQLSTDSMTKILDDTTKAIKASRSGQSNLPLMAMAAGMLSSRGNFGNQLGAGFGAVIPTVQKDREQDEQMQMQLAQIAMKKSALEQAPLAAKLAYAKALQTGDQNAMRAIEQALIRSQNAGQGNNPSNPKIISKALQDSMEDARKQVDNWAKDMDITGDEKEAEFKRRLIQNIKAHQAAGIPIPDAAVQQILGDTVAPGGAAPGASGAGPAMSKFKTYYDSPNEEGKKAAVESGLPPVPAGYIYDKLGRTEKTKMLTEQTKNFQKETKDFDESSAQQRQALDQINQMESIMERKPNLTGPIKGVLPNWLERNTTPDARTLDALFKSQQLHNIPKGQGAVSNMERELFASASPNMENPAAANRNLLNIQKEVIARDRDRRDFFTQYFNNYKTMDGMVAAWDRYISSPAGSSFIRDRDGSPKPNTNRMPWRDYFRTETGAGNRAKGGYIKLGAEYDG